MFCVWVDKTTGIQYKMPMEFEWDRFKAEANRDKHGVTFGEAVDVFADPFNITEFDDANSLEEDRFIVLGMSGRTLLSVVYTEREDVIRLISARRATARERRTYQKQTAQ
jgi:uncharacterized protein